MSMTAQQYARLYNIVFSDSYPGYIPESQEAPNGDGNWDVGKRYAMIAMKYLDRMDPDSDGRMALRGWLTSAVSEAVGIAIDLGLPQKYWPHIQDSAIRILEYPIWAGSAAHTDFDLFTTMLYRNRMDKFIYTPGKFPPHMPSAGNLRRATEKHPGLHFGELMEIINPSAYEATAHEVDAARVTQYSAVFFAMPRLDVHLPNGQLIEDWLVERKGRSRRYT